MDRNRYLAKNTALFALSNVGTKLIGFLLVPLYTGVLRTAEYGTIDLITTVCAFMIPVVTANIAEAVLRFSLDEGADQGTIMGVALFCGFIGTALMLLIFPLSDIWTTLTDIKGYIYGYCCTFALSQIFMCYLRGSEQIFSFSVANILQSFCIAGFNIIFLLFLNLGIRGYFLAYICAYSITGSFAILAGKIPRLFHALKLNLKCFKQMARYSVVLIPNSFMWWIINSSDRIMVTAILGVTTNGIYSVAYKIPSVLTALSTVFTQAWMYSAIHENGSDDKEDYTNSAYLRLFLSLALFTGILLTVLKPFMKVYVNEAYYSAWQYSPFLIIGFLFLSMGTFIGTPYLVNKDSLHYMLSGVGGAVINIILNFILIPRIGANGAAIATCTSYVSVYIYRAVGTRKYVSLKLFTPHVTAAVVILIMMALTEYLNTTAGTVLLYVELSALLMVLKKSLRETVLLIKVMLMNLIRRRKRPD